MGRVFGAGVDAQELDPRIGERVVAPRFGWAAVVPMPRRWFGSRDVAFEGHPVDVSVTGARLLFQGSPPLFVGKVMETRCGATSGWVRVRHLERTPDGVLCGVEYLDLDSELAEFLFQVVAGERARRDWRWTTAW